MQTVNTISGGVYEVSGPAVYYEVDASEDEGESEDASSNESRP